MTVETGDTLSQLALEHLGDASAYPAIFEASKDVVQPGDRRLTDPDHIEPGWTLRVPGSGESGVIPEPETGMPEAPPAEAPGADAEASPEGGAEVEQQGVDQAKPIPGIPEAEPEATLPEAAAEGLQVELESEAEVEADDSAGWPIRTAAGVGALLAGLIVAVLGQRRTRQRRQRKPGDKTPLPGPAAAQVEQEIRAVADQESVDVVDSALRSLADSCEKAGIAPPAIRIVRLRDRQVEVYLQQAVELPAPWQQVGDATAWVTESGEALAAVGLESRYPALVSVGYDAEDGLIMLNLEQLGSFGLVGDRALTAEGAAAIAMELSASPWATRLTLVVVGGLTEVAEVLPGRARYVPDFGDQLISEVLSVPDEQATVVLTMTPLTTSQHGQLRELGAAVVSCDARHHEWALEVTGRDTALLQPVGLDLRPQLVDEATYTGVVEALATSMLDPGVTAAPGAPVVPFGDTHRPHAADPPNETNEDEPETTLPEPTVAEDQVAEDAVPSVDPHDDDAVESTTETNPDETNDQAEAADDATSTEASSSDAIEESGTNTHEPPEAPGTVAVNELLDTGHPVVRLLAPTVDIVGAGADAPSSTTHRAVCTRVATYLALNPGASRPAMVQGVWGGQRISAGTVDSRLSNLRRWFGTNPETGEKYLPPRQLRFADEVTTDWAVFSRLIGPSVAAASTAALEEALTLVRGRPLEGEESKHYAFVEHLLVEMYDTIADAAYELARRRYMDGAWSKAGQAAALGVHLDPGNERLWRLRIHAAHSAGRPDQVAEAIDRMHARISELGFELDEETTELLAAIEQHDLGTIEQSRDAL
ncbi:MAG: BTAD domain-containing putative transcriptional regulator [Nocardioides sp.]|nr:BTAD domain-containing putative transcriptional regulator [Nocardioides sp.]